MDNDRTDINWFPGHMAKTRRIITESLKKVDMVFEICDARIPESSRNPEIARIIGEKKKVVILNKSDLADPEKSKKFLEKIRKSGAECLLFDAKTGLGIEKIKQSAEKLMAEKLEKNSEKGINKAIRAMVVGIPNVGKSTVINKLAGKNVAKAENRPGVTLIPQWVKTSIGLELLDMPGVLWPKFESRFGAENLCATGAIKDEVVETGEIALAICSRLKDTYPKLLSARYGITEENISSSPYEIFTAIGKKRGLLQRGGEIDEERCAQMIIDEFRAGKIGRITLDRI